MACGVFPYQGLNPYLLYWQVDSYPPSHRGSPEYHYIFKISVSRCLLLISRNTVVTSWAYSLLFSLLRSFSNLFVDFFIFSCCHSSCLWIEIRHWTQASSCARPNSETKRTETSEFQGEKGLLQGWAGRLQVALCFRKPCIPWGVSAKHILKGRVRPVSQGVWSPHAQFCGWLMVTTP